MLFPLLALDFHLSLMARSIGGFQVLLADEFLSGHFTVGVIINFLENIERRLAATFGRNLPMTNSGLMVARIVFGNADVVKGQYVSPQRADSLKQSGPFLIDGHGVAIVVAIANACARLSSNTPACELV